MCKCRAALSAVCGGAPKSRGGPVAVSASATGASGVQRGHLGAYGVVVCKYGKFPKWGDPNIL